MWNSDALSATATCSEDGLILSEDIVAMELIPDRTGQMELGPLCNLPSGTEIQICGEGFNNETVKVRGPEGRYFVFLQDLEKQSAPASYAWDWF